MSYIGHILRSFDLQNMAEWKSIVSGICHYWLCAISFTKMAQLL